MDLTTISRPSGAIGVLAIDQRQSLRHLIETETGEGTSPEAMRVFKRDVVAALAPSASGVLLDLEYGGPAIECKQATAPRSGLILAADRIRSGVDGQLIESVLDPEFDFQLARQLGAAALKLLLLWRGEQKGSETLADADAFMKRCRSAGVIGIVEVVIPREIGNSPQRSDHGQQIVEAAQWLAPSRPDLYKCEVPFHGEARARATEAWAKKLTQAIECPWVVLSHGIPSERFEQSVRAVCQGGASGFIAGRAIWGRAVRPDSRNLLVERSRQQLEHLNGVIDREARPWWLAGR